MSTHGTFGFSNNETNPNFKFTTFVYIHHDCHPSGAAEYFYNTLINPTHGDFATQFIRANPNAELTKGHDVHGATLYKYDIVGNGPESVLKAYHYEEWNISKCFYHGNLCAFIDNNHQNIKDYKPFKVCNISEHFSVVWNQVLAEKKFNEYIKELKSWSRKFRDSSNYKNTLEKVQSIVKIFPELMTEEAKKLGV